MYTLRTGLIIYLIVYIQLDSNKKKIIIQFYQVVLFLRTFPTQMRTLEFSLCGYIYPFHFLKSAKKWVSYKKIQQKQI